MKRREMVCTLCLSHHMTKPTKWYLHPVQTLISDQSSMCAHWVAILAKDQKFLHADSED